MGLCGVFCEEYCLTIVHKEYVARMICYIRTMVQFHVLEWIFYLSWSLYLPSTRKGCQNVLMLPYIESIDGQFPIQTETHS